MIQTIYFKYIYIYWGNFGQMRGFILSFFLLFCLFNGLAPDLRESSTKFSCAKLTAAHVGLSSVHNPPDEIVSNRGLNLTGEPKTLDRGEQNGTEASASQKVTLRCASEKQVKS